MNITQTTGALPNGNDVQPRNVNYVYGGPDPEQVTALTNVSNGAAYASYVYDAAGNQSQRVMGGVAWDYLYVGEDWLRRVTKRSVVTPPTVPVVYGIEEYWYDENGARVGVLKRNGSGVVQELIWFIGDTQAHYSAAGAVTKAYSHLSLGTPVARVERNGSATTATNVEYQFHGMASNTLAAVATDGTVNANVVYAPYGEVLEAQEGAGSVFGLAGHRRRFNDKYVDEIGGLGYYGARYYDNVLIGWTQADPKYRVAPDAAWTEPRRASLYAFVMGNPVRYEDPDGMDAVHGDTPDPFAPSTCNWPCGHGGNGPNGPMRGPDTPADMDDEQVDKQRAECSANPGSRACFPARDGFSPAALADRKAKAAAAESQECSGFVDCAASALKDYVIPDSWIDVALIIGGEKLLGMLAKGGNRVRKGGKFFGGGRAAAGEAEVTAAVAAKRAAATKKRLSGFEDIAQQTGRDAILGRGGNGSNVKKIGHWANQTVGSIAAGVEAGEPGAFAAWKIVTGAARYGKKYD